MSFKEEYETLTKDQKEAVDLMINGRNVFLTGEAGTGKSYVVNTFSTYCEENEKAIMKCAPTGIAAVNIEGSTLHHQFGLELGPLTEVPRTYDDSLDGVDIVLIDEISMCRIDVFENVMLQIAMANRNPERMQQMKFIQVILVGDFFQLPPVITEADRYLLEQYFGGKIGKGFAFQSNLWRSFAFRLVNLKTIIRQSDKIFCENLSKARHGDYSCVRYIEDHCAKTAQDLTKSICLTGTNKTALDINLAGLKLVEGKQYDVETIVVGDIQKTDYPCDDEFSFKVNARVMSLLNDKEERFFNGSIGTITSYNEKTGIMKVKFDNGEEVSITKHTFECYKYEENKDANKNMISKIEEYIENTRVKMMSASNEEQLKGYEQEIEAYEIQIEKLKKSKKLNKTVIGTATQYPLKLAYAITIHKSQGQTFESVNIIPQIFDEGQFYVAVSRCKTIDKIYFHGSIDPTKIKANQEVEEFYANPDEYSFFDKKYVNVKLDKEQYNELYGKLLNNSKFYDIALKAVQNAIKQDEKFSRLEEIKARLKTKG